MVVVEAGVVVEVVEVGVVAVHAPWPPSPHTHPMPSARVATTITMVTTRAAALSSPPARTPLRQVHDMLGIMPRSVAALYFNAHPEVEACVPREAYAPFCPPKYMARSGGARADVPPECLLNRFLRRRGVVPNDTLGSQRVCLWLDPSTVRFCDTASARSCSLVDAVPTDFVAPAKEHAGAGAAPSISSQFHAELERRLRHLLVGSSPCGNDEPSTERGSRCGMPSGATQPCDCLNSTHLNTTNSLARA